MKITPVNFNIQKNYSANYTSTAWKHDNKFRPNMEFLSFGSNKLPELSYGKSDLYLNEINELKREVKLFPKDIEYRKNLLKNIGMDKNDYYKLRPILGSAEIQKIMSDFNDSSDYYNAGENMEFVKCGKVRANMHIHTLASDGFLSVQELLNKAANYANFVVKKNPEAKNTPFVIGITDHDTTEGLQEAIKIIANNPLKYKNLRVILGVEMTTYNNIGTKIVNYPTNTHVLAYGIDPNEKKFKKFIENTKKSKFDIADKMIGNANKIYKNIYQENSDFSLDKAKDFSNPVKKGLLGIYNHVLRYIQTEFVANNIILKNKEITESLKENNIPTKTNEFMKKLEEYYYPIDKNNYVREPQNSISEFLSKKTNLESEKINEIIEKGLQEPKAKMFHDKILSKFEEYKVTLEPKYNYMPTFSTLYDSLKNQESAIVGIAHPLDTVEKISDANEKFRFLEDLYKKFANSCLEKAKFSEVYYQSYTKNAKEFSKYTFTGRFLDMLSKTYNLFKTGSADTHRTNIFKRFM